MAKGSFLGFDKQDHRASCCTMAAHLRAGRRPERLCCLGLPESHVLTSKGKLARSVPDGECRQYHRLSSGQLGKELQHATAARRSCRVESDYPCRKLSGLSPMDKSLR